MPILGSYYYRSLIFSARSAVKGSGRRRCHVPTWWCLQTEHVCTRSIIITPAARRGTVWLARARTMTPTGGWPPIGRLGPDQSRWRVPTNLRYHDERCCDAGDSAGRLDSSLRFIDIKTLCLEKPSALKPFASRATNGSTASVCPGWLLLKARTTLSAQRQVAFKKKLGLQRHARRPRKPKRQSASLCEQANDVSFRNCCRVLNGREVASIFGSAYKNGGREQIV